MSQIIIINSGSGNLLSLKRAIEIYDKKVKVSENYDFEILNAKKVFYLVLEHLKTVLNL